MSGVLIGAEYVFLLTAADSAGLLRAPNFCANCGFHRGQKVRISSDSLVAAVCLRVAWPLHTDAAPMPDIATITINPAIDIFVNVSRVEPTRKLRCSAPKRDPGGGGINVARVAHRLGGSVAAIYPTGGAIGKLLQRLVEREGIESVVTPSHVETRENFTAFENDTGEQYRFVLPGSALHRAEWEACLDKLATLPDKPKIVVASGSIPPGVPDDFFAMVSRHAKGFGAKMVLDTSGAAL
jgi:6-phosphofructokinase 2